jgi:hypothetical protein
MNGRRVSLWQPLTEGGAFRGLLDLVCASRLAHVDLYRKQPGPISSKARANVDSSTKRRPKGFVFSHGCYDARTLCR